MLSKILEVYDSVLNSDYDVIALTETWLNSGVGDCEIFDCAQYDVFRCDRDFQRVGLSRGGGVLLAVRKCYQPLLIEREALGVDLDGFYLVDLSVVRVIMKGVAYYIIVIYIPPRTTTAEFESTMYALESLHQLLGNRILIVGDFNIPEYFDCKDGTAPNTNRVQIMNNFCAFYDLLQSNTKLNRNSRLLDLVFSNFPCDVSEPPDVLLGEDAHHPALLVQFDSGVSLGSREVPLQSKGYNFKKAHFLDLYGELCGVDWSFLYTYEDPNSAVAAFYRRLYGVLDRNVPKKKKATGVYPVWFNGKIIRLLRGKRRAWKRYKRTLTVEHHNCFKRLRSQIKALISESHRKYTLQVEREIKTNPKAFWSHINSRRSDKALPSIMVYNGTELRDSAAVADAFADSFLKNFTPPNNIGVTHDNPIDNKTSFFLQLKSISEAEVMSSLRKIPSKQTTGPDFIPAFLLRDCASVFCTPLHFIYNLIIKTSIYPETWKASRVCPVFKKGNKNDVNNYRPVAIINNFSKSFEFILHDCISSYAGRLLASAQHGFVPGRSTTTNLTCITQFIADELDRKHQVDVVYTDFSKAFDRLDHTILVKKLESFGFSRSLVTLFKSYLSGRTQFVQYNGFNSSVYAQASGVPQGTVLGPDLFSIFINDIVADLGVPCLLYADDMKLYQSIRIIDDCVALQGSLDILGEWCIRNRLPLNIKKCNVLSYHRTASPLVYDYGIGGEVLSRPSVMKDLGVIFDPKLTFTNHIESVVAAALRMLGFIMRGCRFMTDIMTFRILYMSFVRTRIEYASIVWIPAYEVHVASLERVQRRFLKTTTFMLTGSFPGRGTPQEDLLRQFNMQSLQTRRDMTSVIFLYKIVNNIIDCPELLYRIGLRVPRAGSRDTQLLHLPYARTHRLSYSPLHQMIHCHSSIEDHCDILNTSISAIREIFQ